MLDSLFRVAALIGKELLVLFKDPRNWANLFLAPIIQCLVFGYVASYDLNNVSYVVLDEDHSSASAALLADLDGSGVFVRVATVSRPEQIASAIDDQRALLGIAIGPSFARDLASGQMAPLQVVADGRNSNTAGIALAYVGAIAQSFGAQWRTQHGQHAPPLVEVVMRAWYNPSLETRWSMVPSLIGTLTLLQTMMLTAMSVAREREQGTFDQLLVAPFRPGEILVGKAIPSMLVGTTQATLVLLVAQLWFRIPFQGSFMTLYVGLLFFLLAAVGIGLMISSFAATMQQAMLFSFVLLMPFTLLSGFTTPVGNMPQVLQYLTLMNPLRYAIDIARRIYLEGAGPAAIWSDLWPLIIIGAITLPVAAWLFRNRLA